MAGKSVSVKTVKLTSVQKEEIRRLTQLANRRIANAMKLYESKGLTIAPYEVTGGIQERSQWVSDKYAISRSVKFNSVKDYKDQLRFLKQFDPKASSNPAPTIVQHGKVQQKKMTAAIETITGGELKTSLLDKISKLDSAKASLFWKDFSEVASKLGTEYSSEALIPYAEEYFKEDLDELTGFEEDEM